MLLKFPRLMAVYVQCYCWLKQRLLSKQKDVFNKAFKTNKDLLSFVKLFENYSIIETCNKKSSSSFEKDTKQFSAGMLLTRVKIENLNSSKDFFMQITLSNKILPCLYILYTSRRAYLFTTPFCRCLPHVYEACKYFYSFEIHSATVPKYSRLCVGFFSLSSKVRQCNAESGLAEEIGVVGLN